MSDQRKNGGSHWSRRPAAAQPVRMPAAKRPPTSEPEVAPAAPAASESSPLLRVEVDRAGMLTFSGDLGSLITQRAVTVETPGNGAQQVTANGSRPTATAALRPKAPFVKPGDQRLATAMPPTAGMETGRTESPWFTTGAPAQRGSGAERGRQPAPGTFTPVTAIYDYETVRDSLLPFRDRVLSDGDPSIAAQAPWFQVGEQEFVRGTFAGYVVSRGVDSKENGLVPLNPRAPRTPVYYAAGMPGVFCGAFITMPAELNGRRVVGQEEYSALPVGKDGAPTVVPMFGEVVRDGDGYGLKNAVGFLAHVDALMGRAAGVAAPAPAA